VWHPHPDRPDRHALRQRQPRGDLEREVRGLRFEVGELRKSVDAQTRQIQTLQEKVDKAGGK
jgi:hypothetical protein